MKIFPGKNSPGQYSCDTAACLEGSLRAGPSQSLRAEALATVFFEQARGDPALRRLYRFDNGRLSEEYRDVLTGRIRELQGAEISFSGAYDRDLLSGEEFPVDDLTYQAKLWCVRAQAKCNSHIHLSVAGYESEIAAIMLDGTDDDFRKAVKKLLEQERKAADRGSPLVDLQNLLKGGMCGVSPQELTDVLEKCSTITCFDGYDFFVQTFSALEEAARLSARRQLEDGVTSFAMRAGPMKISLLQPEEIEGCSIDEKIRHATTRTIQALSRGIERAKAEARAWGVEEPDVRILLSFNRSRIIDNGGMQISEGARISLEHVLARRGDLEGFDKVSGLDISGPEDDGLIPRVAADIASWKPAIDTARGGGFSVSCHLGDTANIIGHLAWLNQTAKDEYYMGSSDSFEETFTRMMSGHLAFMKGFVDLLPDGADIGHGLAMHPECVFYPFHGNSVKTVRTLSMLEFRRGSRTPVLDMSAGLKEVLKARDMGVECCVLAVTRAPDRGLYSEHPLHQWRREGIRVLLGTDGTLIRGRSGITLSEEILRLSLLKK